MLRLSLIFTVFSVLPPAAASAADPPANPTREGFTAIDADGTLHLDRARWLARNNLVYQSPPIRRSDSIPLGSGRVGAAVWIDPAHGLTAMLNRPEGVPAMANLGWLRIRNLASLAAAPDYHGVLSLRDGVFTQTHAGLTIRSFFRWSGEELVIDVDGAPPEETITVELATWQNTMNTIAGAGPGTGANGIAVCGADGSTPSYPGFRASQFIAARATGREVVASANGSGSRLVFKPGSDGRYRLVIPVKLWTGSLTAEANLRSQALAATGGAGWTTAPISTLLAMQAAAFGAMWENTSIIRLRGATGDARYIEQMLALDTYYRIAAALTPLPAVGGGETRLFNWAGPSPLFARNHWYQNLRPINHANIVSGVWTGNQGTWNWLNGWLPALRKHVAATFPGYEGAGYPEYVDGQPGAAGSFLVSQTYGTMNIAPPGTRWYTSRQMSTTLEMIGAILTEADFRGEPSFLDGYWPIIREGMLFHRSLLMSGGRGADGRYHYLGVNARENNWDDDDDTPDVAGITHLLPVVIALAGQRGDNGLVNKLNDLVGKLPDLPTTTRTHPRTNEPVTAIAFSADSRSSGHNAENPDLDAIWPANLISDASDPALVELANHTLDTRVYREVYDWHPTTVQAARMGRAEVFREALLGGIARFMIYPQGFTSYSGGAADVQTEFTAVQTLGAHQALVQNHDGLLRLANSWPAEWEAIASLPCEGGHRVALEVTGGVVRAAVVDLGSSQRVMRIRNPWPGQAFTVRDLTAATTPHAGDQAIATIAAIKGHRLLIERAESPVSSLAFLPVEDSPNTGPTSLGTRMLGKGPGDTFGFADPRLFAWTLADTIAGLANLGSVAHADLQPVGQVTRDASRPEGGGLSLADGYLKTGVIGAVGSDVGATIRLDVKPDVPAGYRRLVDYCEPGSNCDTGFMLDLTPDNHIRLICSGQVGVSGAALATGAWSRVTVSYLAGQAVTITINDAPPQVIPVAGSTINFSSDLLHLSVGADLNGGSRFTGSVANVRITAGRP